MTLQKALVVDDSRLARVALSKLLQRRGLEVDVVGSGKEALEYVRAQAPDVVFLDYMMPDMDGFEAARAIQGLPERGPLPLVMYTSQDTNHDRARARELGICGFLIKPTSEEGVEAVLHEVKAWSPPAAFRVDAGAEPPHEKAPHPAGEGAAAVSVETTSGGGPAAETAAPDTGMLERRARDVAEAVARETLETRLNDVQGNDEIEERLQALRSEMEAGQGRGRDEAVQAARKAAEETVREALDSIRKQASQSARQAAEQAVDSALAKQQNSGPDERAVTERIDGHLERRLDGLANSDAFREQLIAALTDHGVPVLKNALDQWVRERAAEAAVEAVEDAVSRASETMFKEAALAAAEAAVEEAQSAHARLRRVILLGGTILAIGVLAALFLAV